MGPVTSFIFSPVSLQVKKKGQNKRKKKIYLVQLGSGTVKRRKKKPVWNESKVFVCGE